MAPIMLCAGFWLFIGVPVFSQAISSTKLINYAQQLDGRQVIYQGEVIGEIMQRGTHCWININDSQNALGIWIDKNLLTDIAYLGNYKARGDWVEIRGTFNRSCPEHGGDLDIHALSLRKIEAGRLVEESFEPAKLRLAVFTGIALLVLLGAGKFWRFLQRRAGQGKRGPHE